MYIYIWSNITTSNNRDLDGRRMAPGRGWWQLINASSLGKWSANDCKRLVFHIYVSLEEGACWWPMSSHDSDVHLSCLKFERLLLVSSWGLTCSDVQQHILWRLGTMDTIIIRDRSAKNANTSSLHLHTAWHPLSQTGPFAQNITKQLSTSPLSHDFFAPVKWF